MIVTLVIPCYNEAQRLPLTDFKAALQTQPGLHLLMVNDGSRDATLRMLEQLRDEVPGQVRVLDLPVNVGKAEAVRRGLLAALQPETESHTQTTSAPEQAVSEPEYVGYWDADLATPLSELPRFVEVMQEQPGVQWVMGSRVKMLGWNIERLRVRHYVGRVFATCAALALGCEVYDTQCGAKLMRASEAMVKMLEQPTLSRWLVDVELLLRLRQHMGGGQSASLETLVYELPLRQWREVGESKVKPMDLFRSLGHLWSLHRQYRSTRGSA